ncbi:MAG: PASTA domain-containing protein, partial [Prevotellaceae bacterium]|nr:PASTA domain-containing protein [Prevotellaceae bacterium]
MTFKEFFHKLTSRYLWGNLIAMALVLVALVLGLFLFLNAYTHHGETVVVPDLRGQRCEVAINRLRQLGLRAEIADTGYNALLSADAILDQNIPPGGRVKLDRLLLLTINSAEPRPIVLPDIADNSSLREARMRLEVLGFKLTPVKRIRGDRDWVYRIEAAGREVHAGDRLNVNIPLTLVVGDGVTVDDYGARDSSSSSFDVADS